MIREDKQQILNKICEALQLTKQLSPGVCNGLKELRYIRRPETGEPNVRYFETARPIFEDGAGSNGWYDVNISGDSGIAIFLDVVKQFVAKI